MGRRPPFFLRSRSPLRWLFALPFAAGCAGVVALVVAYHWPPVEAAACFFAACPVFVCFGATLPLVLAGFWGLKLRWFLFGCVLWASGFAATDDVAQWLSLFPGRAREAFESLHGAFLHGANHAPPGQEGMYVPLRVVTWNLASRPRLVANALRELADLEPDLVFLQEVNAEVLPGAMRRSDWFASYHLSARYGRALVSRFPITPLPGSPLPPTRGDLSRIEVAPGFRISCMNVHLARRVLVPRLIRSWSPGGFEDAIEQTKQGLDELRDTLQRHSAHEALLLAGDFNLPPHYPDLRAATRGMIDTFASSGFGWGKTVPAWMPVFRTDMIFVPPDAVVHYAGTVSTKLSDHCMAIAEVSLLASRSPESK